MKRFSLIFNVALLILITIILIYNPRSVTTIVNTNPDNIPPTLDELSRKYPYLAKRIIAEDEIDLLVNFMPLRKNLREFVAPFGDNFAFYFEYLPTGTSIGVNEKNNFNPASLGKVPLAMALYLGSEKGTVKRDQKVSIQLEHINDKSGSLYKRGVGTELSLGEVIDVMLRESDNTAAAILAEYVIDEDYQEVYKGLDIEFPADNNNLISAKGYSSILKALYFSSVLNKEDSQRILNLLTETIFKDKLVAGVPKGVSVAHKIGFWGEELYSDCGIVYVPHRSYLLCMISKSNENEARSRMKTASQVIYNYISTFNRP